MIKTILIHNDPEIAADAQAAGVDRIMVDLEIIGKKERQKNRQTFISTHRREDIPVIRKALTSAELIVRINPWYEESEDEIDYAIGHGADIIMLPMITDMEHIERFAKAVKARARTLPLIETAFSMERLRSIACRSDMDEIYIGLNDLHLSLRLPYLFEPLASGLIDTMAQDIKACGKSFGFGGIAAVGSGELPAQRLLAEHARLGSSCVILSSRFGRDVQLEQPQGRKQRLVDALHDLQSHYQRYKERSAEQQECDRAETCAIIRRIMEERNSAS